MTFEEVMQTLESSGTAQTRKTYARHGVTGACFGVSYATLGQLKKKIKQDQALAEALWETENHDARILATMIGTPAACTKTQLEHWRKSLDDYVLVGAFAKFVAGHPAALSLAEKWKRSRSEMTATCGWDLYANLCHDSDMVDDETCRKLLLEIEKTIHTAANRVRYSMNQTLIVIGVRPGDLREEAMAVAERVGKVEVDHGETNCKTPLAASYIRKTIAHQEKKATNGRKSKAAGGKTATKRASKRRSTAKRS